MLITSFAIVLAASAAAASLTAPLPATEKERSPAQSRIDWARAALARAPEGDRTRVGLTSEMAFALARRARETGDTSFYDEAMRTLAPALALAPEDLQARTIEVWIMLGRHEFAAALEKAQALNRRAPDDVQVYGLIADAAAELGEYATAESAVQWMLDLRPGNVAGLTRGAYLREVFGDIDGAIDFMTLAYQRTPPDELEDRAWLLTHIGHLMLLAGRADDAESASESALELFPDYHYALAMMARVRTAQGRHAEAAEILARHVAAAPHPENHYYYAEALQRAGRHAEAAAAYAEFETKARGEMNAVDNANRELVLYSVDRANRSDEALRIASAEIARRRDVFTRDALAWALSAVGRHAEAREAIGAALGVGTSDPRLLYHAGIIAMRQGDRDGARLYLERAIKSASESTQPALEALASLSDDVMPGP